MQTFYNDLHTNTQIMVDSGGSVNNKTPNEVYDLIETMAKNNYERALDYHAKKRKRIIEMHEMASLKAQDAKQMACKDASECNSNSIPSVQAVCG